MKRQILFLILIPFIFMVSTISFAQNNLSKRLAQISEKEQQIREIDSLIVRVQQEYQHISKEIENTTQKDGDEKDNKKRVENQKTKLELDIERLKNQKKDKEIEILEIEALIFEDNPSSPVWAEGYGETALEEGKTVEECKRLALMYARRDAMEKGGNMIVESFTSLKRSENVSKDKTGIEIEYFERYLNIIKSKAMVKVIDQDLSNDYGKVIRVDQGDHIKFTAKVRLKMKSIDDYNPYKIKIEELTK